MEGKVTAFRALSVRLRKETCELSRTPSDVLVSEDRASGHRDT